MTVITIEDVIMIYWMFVVILKSIYRERDIILQWICSLYTILQAPVWDVLHPNLNKNVLTSTTLAKTDWWCKIKKETLSGQFDWLSRQSLSKHLALP